MLQAVRKDIPWWVPLCASQMVRAGTVAVIQERGKLHNSVVKCVWQRSTLSSASLLLDLLEQDAEIT